jgi:hypothetical protein
MLPVKCEEWMQQCGGIGDDALGPSSGWVLADANTAGGVIPLKASVYETWLSINTAGNVNMEGAVTDDLVLEDGTSKILKEY